MHILAAGTGDPMLDWFTQAGAVGVLGFIVLGFIRGWLVTGATHARVLAEKERAIDLVYEQAKMTQRALEVAERQKSS
jgi:hypothetical protein